jgi:cysteinyl-tRNA synthetase
LGGILGILQEDPAHFLQTLIPSEEKNIADIIALITERDQARLAKDWALSDKIRQQLIAKGVELEDSKTGTTWRWIV